jgi:hypothetical protein
MDLEEVVLGLVEARQLLVPRCLGEVPAQPVGPAVVLTREDVAVALVLGDDGEAAVPADVVEGVDDALVVPDDDKLVAGDLVPDPVSRVGDPGLVCGEQPLS